MQKKNSVEYLIKKFGGLRATARGVNRAPSGVHRWRVNGRIPRLAMPSVLRGAKRNGLTLNLNRLM